MWSYCTLSNNKLWADEHKWEFRRSEKDEEDKE